MSFRESASFCNVFLQYTCSVLNIDFFPQPVFEQTKRLNVSSGEKEKRNGRI